MKVIMDSISSSLKAPKTKHPILPEIAARWSPRSFSERMITLEELETMIEAATWAPSSTNDQPWRYVAAFRGTQLFQDYFDCLMPGNRFWADKASVILVSLAVKDFAANGAHNRHAMYDVGAANTLLLVQGASMGIYGHQMGGFDMAKSIQQLGVPAHMEIACFIALGFLDSPDKLEEPFRTRELTPRSRKPLEHILLDDLTGL
jgi:nitroreductase